MTVAALPFRAVELHGRGFWERSRVERTLAFMKRHDLNALVIHESDLVHQLVYPKDYFDPYALWRDAPSRRGENAIFNNRAYFESVLVQARDIDVSVWINVKEIGFSDEVLSIRPEVFKNGAICPSEPFWMEYVAAKTDELFADFPALAGMIVSFGSQESRASRAQNRCKCHLCCSEPLEEWYGRIIEALHAPIARRGKKLAVRDFAYKPSDHAPLIAAVERAPEDVIFCIKAMPHDFYVTFPDNPALGVLNREQWVEYDCLGQFFGWGVMPCFVFTDLAERIPRWVAKGATGAVLRIEWERINDLDCFDNLSELNLLAAAALVSGENIGPEEVCSRWLASRGLPPDLGPWLADILSDTLPIVRRAAYINDFVSADNSMLPRSIKRAWWGAEVRDALAPWAPGRNADLDLDRRRLLTYLAEKDEALDQTAALMSRLRRDLLELDNSLRRDLERAFAFFEDWVQGLCLTARVCLYARFISRGTNSPSVDDMAEFARSVAQLDEYTSRIRSLGTNPGLPHHVPMLVDYRRAADVAREAHALLLSLRERSGLKADRYDVV